MAQFQSQHPLPGYDPTPNVATPDEIRQAEELRHRIEERYLDESPAKPAPSPAKSGGAH